MITFSLDGYNDRLVSIQKDGVEVGVAYFYQAGLVSVYEWVDEDRECQVVVADLLAVQVDTIAFFQLCVAHFSKKEFTQ
jgi:hypothetical protein